MAHFLGRLGLAGGKGGHEQAGVGLNSIPALMPSLDKASGRAWGHSLIFTSISHPLGTPNSISCHEWYLDTTSVMLWTFVPSATCDLYTCISRRLMDQERTVTLYVL